MALDVLKNVRCLKIAFMKNNIIYIITYIITHICSLSFAQTEMIAINSSQIKQNGGFIILKNTTLKNNSTFHSDSGTVIISGDASDANSKIGGSSFTIFSNLKIDKSANNTMLDNSITIGDTLMLTNGLFDISQYHLNLSDTAIIIGANANRYIKTSSTGRLKRAVSGSYVDFPVGNNTYSPLAFFNLGDVDTFSVGVENVVYQNGTSGNELTNDAIDISWHIKENTIGKTSANFIFQWYESEELTGFDRANCSVANYTNGGWAQSAVSSASGTNPYLQYWNNVKDLGIFTVLNNTTLPVELLYFYAQKEGKNVRLDWQTATELNNSHFDIEWSRDGVSFEKIGKVAGAGTTNEVQFYDFLHLSPILGQNYYRLKQIDLPDGQAGFDGKFKYTNIISIEFKKPNNITFDIYPNPTAHYLKIESEDFIGKIVQIFSVNGQLVKELQHQSLITNLSITNLSSGIYFIKMGEQVKKLIIEK